MDVDFDVVVTAPCPMPNLIQRLGRAIRHDRGFHRNGTLVLIGPEEDIYQGSPERFSDEVYDIGRNARTWEVVRRLDDSKIVTPADCGPLVERCEPQIEDGFSPEFVDAMRRGDKRTTREESSAAAAGRQRLIPRPNEFDSRFAWLGSKDPARTRQGTEGETIIVLVPGDSLSDVQSIKRFSIPISRTSSLAREVNQAKDPSDVVGSHVARYPKGMRDWSVLRIDHDGRCLSNERIRFEISRGLYLEGDLTNL
ncbi:MAG: hypothetical protein NVSMB14_05090 [Isosphaeraceae bacterium]